MVADVGGRLFIVGYCRRPRLLYFAQRSILFPIPENAAHVAGRGRFSAKPKNMFFQTSDGEKIVAWHVPPREGKPVMIFFHGNGDILAWRAPWFARR